MLNKKKCLKLFKNQPWFKKSKINLGVGENIDPDLEKIYIHLKHSLFCVTEDAWEYPKDKKYPKIEFFVYESL